MRDNVRDLSTTEWRIIQEVGYGSPIKKLGQTLLVRRNRAQLLINDFGEIKPTRDRTQLAIWSVQTGVTRRDFLKEIQNEIEGKASLLGDWSPLLCSV